MKPVIRGIEKINEAVGKFFGLWILILIAIVIYEVVMRYVFNSPTLWVHELSTFIFGIMWVLAGGYTLSKKGMVNMDALTIRFSEKNQARINIGTFIFAFLFCLVLVWLSGERAWNSVVSREVSGSVISPPYYPIRIALFLGALLVLLQLIANLLKDIYIAVGRKDNDR
jgi:TRAP-type mannitol/chloroaromatic compound transport system permease small subunit